MFILIILTSIAQNRFSYTMIQECSQIYNNNKIVKYLSKIKITRVDFQSTVCALPFFDRTIIYNIFRTNIKYKCIL